MIVPRKKARYDVLSVTLSRRVGYSVGDHLKTEFSERVAETTSFAPQARIIGPIIRSVVVEVVLCFEGREEPRRGRGGFRRDGTWRNMTSGSKLAGLRPARLTRAKAEDLLADLEDRVAQFNLQYSNGAHTQRVVALVAVLTEHDPIQGIDMACS
jgi:hypothetical protein